MGKLALICCCLFAGLPLFSASVLNADFRQISGGVWLHRSWAFYNGQKTPANGLLIDTGPSLVLIDTAWDNPQTRQILDFARQTIRKPIEACLVTHSHADKTGGLDEIFLAGIPVLMIESTCALLKKAGMTHAVRIVADGPLPTGGLAIHIAWPGPAHAPDNVVVWIPRRNLLFGGCIVKSLDADSPGNTADADLDNWKKVCVALLGRYGQATIVVPGHGEPGGLELIRHTVALLP